MPSGLTKKERWALYKKTKGDKVKKYQREYYLRNREKILARQKANPNPEKNARARKKYNLKHKDKLRIFYSQRDKRHRDVLKQIQLEEKNKRFVDLVKKGLALERRKVWKQLKHDYEFRYYLKIA